VSAKSDLAAVARRILDDLEVAFDAAEGPRWERCGVGVQLRSLLTMSDPSTGPLGRARLTVLAATGHSEIGDQIRGTGGCRTGAEKAVEFSEDTDLEVLAAGLQQLAKLGDDPA